MNVFIFRDHFMMGSFWPDYLSDCGFASNCVIISGDRKAMRTHKLLLAAVSDDLRSFMLSTPDWTEEACFVLPDCTLEQIQECFDTVLSRKESHELFSVLGIFSHSRKENYLQPGKPVIKHHQVSGSDKVRESDNQVVKDEFQLLSSVEQSLSTFEHAEENFDLHQAEYEPRRLYKKKRKKLRRQDADINERGTDLDGVPVPVSTHICEYCNRKFKSDDSLFGHITLKHPEKHEFLKFMVEIGGKFQCTICKKIFPKRRRCNIHIRSKHKVGAKLQCDVCQQLFYFKHELDLHMVKHNQRKDAYCHLCGKGVRVAANLERHMLAFHTDKADKETARAFFCSVCGKGFFTSGALKEHEMLHSDNYNFQCSECPKTFKQSAGLRTHFKRHHTNFEKTPEQKAKFAEYMKQYRAKQREKEKLSQISIVSENLLFNADNKKVTPSLINNA